MSTGTLFDMQSQMPMFTGVPLVEELRPRVLADLVGLVKVKAALTKWLKAPRSQAFLFVGPPGVGKTVAAECLARELNATTWTVNSQECKVETLQDLCFHMSFVPASGLNGFHCAIINEACLMSTAAENFLLSKLCEGMMKNVVWIFTSNDADTKLSERFLSRCLRMDFNSYGSNSEIEARLRETWDRKMPGIPAPAAIKKCVCGNLRESYNRLELLLLEN